jgi:hypothetical protein
LPDQDNKYSTAKINTNQQCITAIKEYQGKSLEEIRFEDYQNKLKKPALNFGSSTTLNTANTKSRTFQSSRGAVLVRLKTSRFSSTKTSVSILVP